MLAKLIHVLDHEFLSILAPVNAMKVRTVDHIHESLYKWRYAIASTLARLHVECFPLARDKRLLVLCLDDVSAQRNQYLKNSLEAARNETINEMT